MKKSKLIIYALVNSLGVLFYVLLVAWIIFNGEKIFGQMAITGDRWLFYFSFVCRRRRSAP